MTAELATGVSSNAQNQGPVGGLVLAQDLVLLIRTTALLFVAVFLGTACSVHETDSPPVTETFCEMSANSHTPRDKVVLDLLLVIDRTSAMSPHAEALQNSLREIGALDNSWLDWHVAIVAADDDTLIADAQLPDCSEPEGAYLSTEREPWFRCGDERTADCSTRNFDGPMEDVLACVGTLETQPGADRQPLEAAVLALDSAPEGFLRPNSDGLLIVIVGAGDDQSPRGLEEYVELLTERGRGAFHTGVVVVAPPGATRLADFYQQVSHIGQAALVVTDDWVAEVEQLIGFFSQDIIPYSCLRWEDPYELPSADNRDTAPGNPGIQPNCVATPMRERLASSSPMKIWSGGRALHLELTLAGRAGIGLEFQSLTSLPKRLDFHVCRVTRMRVWNRAWIRAVPLGVESRV